MSASHTQTNAPTPRLKKKRPASHYDLKDLRLRRSLKKFTRFVKTHLFLIVAAIASTVFYSLCERWNGSYMDADGYARALRIYHFLINPSFAEQPLYESNSPFGEILHWTRPMDVYWSLLTLPFINTFPLKDVVFIAGAFTSPLLLFPASLALAYGLRRRFNPYLCIFGVLLFLADPRTESHFSPARADHHALTELFCLYAFSLVLCWLKKRHHRYLRLLGLTLALLTFTAAEGLLIYAIFLSFFLYLYVIKNLSLAPTVKIAQSFALSITICWLLNPPYEGWFYPDNGRVSILYVTAAFLAYAAFFILDRLHLHTPRLKFVSLALAAASSLLILLFIFGASVFHAPLDAEIMALWADSISEMKSITALDFASTLELHGFSTVSLVLALYMFHQKPYRRLMAYNLCIGLPLFALSLWALRFSLYHTVYCTLPWLCWLEMQYNRSPFARRQSHELPDNLWLYALFILITLQLFPLPYNLKEAAKDRPQTYTPALCAQIKSISGTLVTSPFLSPKYVFNCDVSTVGTPYHRNRNGLKDNYNILHATTDRALIPLLLKHQVTQILIINRYDDNYLATEKNKGKLFYKLITRKDIPAFLKEVKTVNKDARLYQTNF